MPRSSVSAAISELETRVGARLLHRTTRRVAPTHDGAAFYQRCVRLIGLDTLQTHRATQDTQDTSINFLTGAVVVRSGNAQTDATTQRRSRLAANPRRCLPDLDSAAGFQPLGTPR